MRASTVRQFAHSVLAVAAAGLALVLPALAEAPRVAVEVPPGVPLEVVSSDFSDSDFEPRGGALVIDLSGWVRFRHAGPHRVRAVTLDVHAGRQVIGGRAAVAVPSLNAGNGQHFEVRLNLRLLRPLPLPTGTLVEIAADSLLLDTLAAVGPDRLESIDRMRTREMEARRDRAFFLTRWEAGGRGGLAAAMQASLRRQAARPRVEVALAGDGPATAADGGTSRRIQLAMVNDELAPVALEAGTAIVTGIVSDAPQVTVRNVSRETVRRFELGWLVSYQDGALRSVGSAPVPNGGSLAAGQRAQLAGTGKFELRRPGSAADAPVEGMKAYLRSAHLASGTVWVPSRSALQESGLLDIVPVSHEEQRLAALYRTRGPQAVLDELRNFAGVYGAGRASETQ